MQFNRAHLKLILDALETIQRARSAITTDAIVQGDYIRADAALKDQADREQLIHRIKEYLNQH